VVEDTAIRVEMLELQSQYKSLRFIFATLVIRPILRMKNKRCFYLSFKILIFDFRGMLDYSTRRNYTWNLSGFVNPLKFKFESLKDSFILGCSVQTIQPKNSEKSIGTRGGRQTKTI